MTFGEKLQKLRAQAGLSQDALAELLDVSRQAVSKWERDEAMPEAEKLVRISRQFGVSTDYLLLEELEEPEMPGGQAPAAGIWERLKRWYWNKGYLLAWILLAWGGWRLAAAAVDTAVAYQQNQRVLGLDMTKLLLLGFVPAALPAALLVVVSVLLVFRGRRMAGRLRWYHLGWLPVLLGLLGTGVSGFWETGTVWTIAYVLLWSLLGESPRVIEGYFWASASKDLFCLLATILGLTILLQGCRHDRKNAPANTE